MSAESIPNYPFDRATPLEPPTEWAQLRGQCPVASVRLPSGDVAGLVTGYDDVRAALADRRFNRRGEGMARMATTEDGGLFSRPSPAGEYMSSGPGHQRWRRLLSRSFTVRRMEMWRPRVAQMTDELVDAMVDKGSPANLSTQLAFQLPVGVICALVGAPRQDRDKFAHWSQVMLTLTRYSQAEVDQAYHDFDAYVSELVDRNRANPGEDLLTELTQISDAEDGRLSHAELILTVRGLLLAGHETTSNMIGSMMAMVLSDRQRFEAVIADPELIKGTVEEVLRLDNTLQAVGVPRLVTEGIELGGVPVPAGTTLLPNTPAANRDPRKFVDPDRFDPRRKNGQEHLTFGAGPHFCIGQPLARMELQVVLGTLARRLPTLRLRDSPDDLQLRTGMLSGGLQDVAVTW